MTSGAMKRRQTGKEVVSLGDLVLDTLVEEVRLPVEAKGHQQTGAVRSEPGGAGNFLITAARLGLKATALGVAGGDPFGRQLLELLQQEGVTTQLVEIHEDECTSTVFVLKDKEDSHAFLGSLANGRPVRFSAAWQEALRTCDALQLWGYSLLEERVRPAIPSALACARQWGIPIFFDPGPLAAQIEPDVLQQVMGQSAVICLNQEEIFPLTGSRELDSVKRFLAEGVNLVCVKRGNQGCVVFQGDQAVEHAGFPVSVADTAGAGDAFNAGLMFAWLHDWAPEQAAAFANAVGAAKARKKGTGRQMPTHQEVLALLAKYQVSVPALVNDD